MLCQYQLSCAGAVVQPLPSSHLIFRAPSQVCNLPLTVNSTFLLPATRHPTSSTLPLPTATPLLPPQAAGKCWMDAMELAVRCSSILLRSMPTSPGPPQNDTDIWNEADIEKHFMDQGSVAGGVGGRETLV